MGADETPALLGCSRAGSFVIRLNSLRIPWDDPSTLGLTCDRKSNRGRIVGNVIVEMSDFLNGALTYRLPWLGPCHLRQRIDLPAGRVQPGDDTVPEFAPDSYYPIKIATCPETWELVKVGDVITDIQPGFSSGKHNQLGLGIPHLRPMNIDRLGQIDLSVVKYVSRENGPRLRFADVLFNNTNSPQLVGKTAWIGQDAGWAFSNHMTRLRMTEGLVPKFVAYQLHYLWMTGYFLHRCVKYVNQASVSSTALGETVALVLPPLPEQRRIVAEIEKQFTRLDAAESALRRVEANLKRYRASVLKAACEGKLVPTEAELAEAEGRDYEHAEQLLERILAERRALWESQEKRKGKYREPAAPDTSDLPELPKGWKWASLPQLGELNRGKSKHRPRNDPRLLGGPYPFVQTGDVKHSRGLIAQHSQTYSEFGLAQSRLWPAGTLCITIAANIAETGILAYPACFPDSVVGFVNNCDESLTKFTAFFFQNKREELEKFAPATAQKNINLRFLSELAIHLPPLAEQRRIVDEVERNLSIVQQSEAAVEASLKRSERLRQSILKRAFCGQLVPQDPDDEPASILLERIHAEREAASSAATKRRQSRRRTKSATDNQLHLLESRP